MIRVLIVDDHLVVREGLQSMLSSKKYGIEIVDEARDGKQAVEKAIELKPDVVLMDLQMPGMSGMEAIQEIKKLNLESHILVLTSFGEKDRVAAAMQAGASGYLLKDSSPDELVNAIQAVALGHVSIPQKLYQSIITSTPEESTQSDDIPINALSSRELDVLHYLADGASNKEIASQLSISLTTVRTHVSNILRKLDLENRTQAALFAREHGLTE